MVGVGGNGNGPCKVAAAPRNGPPQTGRAGSEVLGEMRLHNNGLHMGPALGFGSH